MEQEQQLNIEDLFGEDKRKQAAVAFRVVQSLNGYDTTVFMIPQDKKKEIMKVLKTARQIVIINRNKGFIAAFGNSLNFYISILTANSFAVMALLTMQKEGIKAKQFVDELKGDWGLGDIGDIIKTDDEGKILFENNDVIFKKIKQGVESYNTIIPTGKSIIDVIRTAAKIEYFGEFIDPDLMKNCDLMERTFFEFNVVLNREIDLLYKCMKGETKKKPKIFSPDLLKKDRNETAKWKNILRAVNV